MTNVIINYTGDFILEEQQVAKLRSMYPELRIKELAGREFVPAELADTDVFIGNPTNDMLAAMPRLRWIQLHSAGANAYIGNPALRSDITVTNASGVFGVPGAEQALALMLALTREIHLHVKQQLGKVWRQNTHCLEVQDSVVLVLGLGDIGTEIAKRAKGLGAYVIAIKRSPGGKPEFVDELMLTGQLEEALPRADYIVSSLPLTTETKGLLSAERIARMKTGAVFINVGRGATVEEEALVAALRSGKLGGAGLDVTAVEPLPQESPLWEMPNVILTSHSVNTSPRKAERRAELFSRNLGLWLAGRPVENQVNLTLGY